MQNIQNETDYVTISGGAKNEKQEKERNENEKKNKV